MIRIFTWRLAVIVSFISAFCGIGDAFAQQTPGAKKDSVKVQIPAKINESKNYRLREGAFINDPINLVRTFEYDPITNRYVMYERVGNLLYRPPQYLTFDEYLRYKERKTGEIILKRFLITMPMRRSSRVLFRR